MRSRRFNSIEWIILILVLGCMESCSIFDSAKIEKAKGELYTLEFNDSNYTPTDPADSDYAYKHKKGGKHLMVSSYCKRFQRLELDRLAKRGLTEIGQLKISKEK